MDLIQYKVQFNPIFALFINWGWGVLRTHAKESNGEKLSKEGPIHSLPVDASARLPNVSLSG